MVDLDSQADIEKKDTGKILASIRLLPDQMEQAWEEIKNSDVPKQCYLAKNVVICGMGGSALGGRIVDSLLLDRVQVPIEIFNQYNVPNYVDKDSFVIVSSYSGNTEETVSAAHQALAKGAKVFGTATGGKIAELLERKGQPRYIFEPRANPSGQPRMGLGYSIAATLSILSKCRFINLTEDDFYELVVTTRKFVKRFDVDVESSKNLAKIFSKKLHNKAVVLIASSHLVGVAHAFKNQLNESSKTFSTLFELPELNHHLLEGLKFPIKARKIFHFLFFNSNFYHERVKKRLKLTEDVIENNGHKCSLYTVKSETKLSQIFEVLTLGSFISFYLAMLYGINPTEIPWIDYFKQKLAKS
jgi:glucose/mannose-6-phosphate isomerase